MAYIPQYKLNNEKVGHFPKKKLPSVLRKEQLVKMLKVSQNIKLSMVIFIGSFQGLRISEILKLRWRDVDIEYGEIRVLDAKNVKRYQSGYGKDRIVPINDMFIPIYKAWKAMNPNAEFVIPTKKNDNLERLQTHIGSYQMKFQEVLDKVGLLIIDYYQQDSKPRYKYHLHTLRHVCGTNLYRAGMDLYQIKEFLGHERVESTEIYCELARDDIKLAAHNAYAYPKSAVPLPDQPEISIAPDRETLRLQKEILDRQLEMLRLEIKPMAVR